MPLVNRRRFLQTGTLAATGLAAAPLPAPAGEARAPVKFHLGMVTYDIAADWDLPPGVAVGKGMVQRRWH